MSRPILVLSGASSGIGHATVRLFSDAGWRIISCSRRDIPEHCKADPNWTHHFCCDLASREAIEDFINQVTDLLGHRPVHALINNAAISPKTDLRQRLGCMEGDIKLWDKVFQINLLAPLMLARGFAKNLARAAGRSSGTQARVCSKDASNGDPSHHANMAQDHPDMNNASIVNITSIAGHNTHPFAGSAYAVSKAGLSALTRELAVEFAAIGVRVNALAPGEIATEMIGPEYESLVEKIPMHRFGRADEVARLVFSMCQPGFGFVTGTEIFATGGQHLL
ncbi:MAG: SDR family oxidoreductase [Pseudomonadota bacterium]